MVGQPPTMGYLLNGIHEINTPLGDIKRRKSGYPPVNCPITMENHHFSWENHGKSAISMAIFNSKLLNYQRVETKKKNRHMDDEAAKVCFMAFLIFEFCVGVYFPSIGTVKSELVPDSWNASCYGKPSDPGKNPQNGTKWWVKLLEHDDKN